MILRTLLLVGAIAATAPLYAQTPGQTAIRSGSTVDVARHEVVPGDTLDKILADAGIAASTRSEAALAIAEVFDLSTLSPGQVLRWRVSADDPGRLERLSLLTLDGIDIVLDFNKVLKPKLVRANIQLRDRRETFEIDGSLYEALVAHNVPENFAVELAALLAGQVDFRRDLKGNERMALIWQESALPDGTMMAEPALSYARLELGQNMFELVAGSADHSFILFRDGSLVQQTARPVKGARLSSVFGKRRHPVLGVQRLHTGVDYAAETGTPVMTTGAGKVIFAGTMRGYGRTIDIDHGSGVVTRYAHLSRFAAGLAEGTEVSSGDRIGSVGATGLVSGPNLHYEVRIDGQPTDPMQKTPAARSVVAKSADRFLLVAGRAVTGFFIRNNIDDQG